MNTIKATTPRKKEAAHTTKRREATLSRGWWLNPQWEQVTFNQEAQGAGCRTRTGHECHKNTGMGVQCALSPGTFTALQGDFNQTVKYLQGLHLSMYVTKELTKVIGRLLD